MTDPHSEIIIAAVLDQLRLISEAGGFFTTPKRIQRYDRKDESRVERPYLTIRKASEGKTLRGNSWDCTLTLDIEGAISWEEDQVDGRDTDAVVAQLQDDIERALVTVNWESVRAKLEQIDITNILYMDSNDVEDGLQVRVRINYGHDYASTRTPLAI